jgi:predicted ATPase/DNA-binding NarL/FixJ family response regulator
MADILASIQRPGAAPAAADMAPLLPVAGPIVGRDREIAQIVGLLDDERVRVLSLLGPGGVGKTRLAQEVVRQAGDDFAHGAAFVSLAPVRMPDLVPFAVAQALDVQERGEVSLVALLADWLQSRHMLLVLDNMEHVVDAAYPWLARLIATCPRLKVLVTSRIALDIAGEQRVRVRPLPVPGDDAPDRLGANASVALFTQRARAIRNDFTLDGDTVHAVASICTRVDGLPLAIELAASRINAFSPADILSQLTESLASLAGTRRDAPPRLRSLRDAITWSYDLLSPEEQDLFRRLAVFVGGFSLEAAEASGADAREPAATRAVADLVGTLVDHSLVERLDGAGRTRFRMLETIREFGIAQLAERDELTAARDRHAAYYLRLAETAETGLKGPDQAAWLELLDVEHGNLREAMDWLTATGRVSDAIDLYSSIDHSFLVRGHYTEIRQLLDGWSLHPDVGRGTRAHARVLVAGATLASYLELPESPIPAYLEALETFRELGDRRLVMQVLEGLSFYYAIQGNRERATATHGEHLALARELGDARSEAVAFDVRARLAMHDGDMRQARSAIEASLAIAREAGDLCVMAMSTSRLGELALEVDGDIERGRTLFEESRSIHERLGDTRNLPFDYMGLAEVERTIGNLDMARSHLLAALPLFQHTGLALGEASIHTELARIAMLRGDPPGAFREVRQALAGRRQFEDVPGAADDLALLAELALVTSDPCSAARFLGASERLLRGSTSTPADISSNDSRQALTARARAGLDAETFEQHHAAGTGWSLQESIAAALAFDSVPETPDQTGPPERPHGLSPRELEVLRLMADGLSNREIADALFLSVRTVTSHISGVLGKLDLSSRTQAVAYAIRNDIA